jgi:hypothetical protein
MPTAILAETKPQQRAHRGDTLPGDHGASSLEIAMNTKLTSRRLRARVVRAFRRMARATSAKAAYAATVRFYHAAGHAWTRQ